VRAVGQPRQVVAGDIGLEDILRHGGAQPGEEQQLAGRAQTPSAGTARPRAVSCVPSAGPLAAGCRKPLSYQSNSLRPAAFHSSASVRPSVRHHPVVQLGIVAHQQCAGRRRRPGRINVDHGKPQPVLPRMVPDPQLPVVGRKADRVVQGQPLVRRQKRLLARLVRSTRCRFMSPRVTSFSNTANRPSRLRIGKDRLAHRAADICGGAGRWVDQLCLEPCDGSGHAVAARIRSSCVQP
jgi:hypothetical protein